MNYKFAHLADLHLGGWRDRYLTQLNFRTFQKAITKILEEKVDFVIFAGDIFNTAMPSLDIVNDVIKECNKLKEKNIPIYVIGGSHDYSATGKSFIQLLDTAGIVIDVGKSILHDRDEIELLPTKHNDNIYLYGVAGKQNNLEQITLKKSKNVEQQQDIFKLFLFHTTIQDLQKKDSKYSSKTYLKHIPRGFDYYAAGHVHTFIHTKIGSAPLYFPGPLFPNSFKELLEEVPSFIITTINTQTKQTTSKRIKLQTYKKIHLKHTCSSKLPHQEKEEILKKLNNLECKDSILLLEIDGILDGKVSDLQLSEIVDKAYEQQASHVLKNTRRITTKAFNNLEISIRETKTHDVESELLDKIISDSKEKKLAKELFVLDLEKKEGEKIQEYEQRILEVLEKQINTVL
jgi:hypothetical protein